MHISNPRASGSDERRSEGVMASRGIPRKLKAHLSDPAANTFGVSEEQVNRLLVNAEHTRTYTRIFHSNSIISNSFCWNFVMRRRIKNMREHLRGESFYTSWIQKQKERLDAKISGAPDPHPELEINFLDEVVVNLVFIHIAFAFAHLHLHSQNIIPILFLSSKFSISFFLHMFCHRHHPTVFNPRPSFFSMM